MTNPRTSGVTEQPTQQHPFREQGTETLSAQRASGSYDGDFDELSELEHDDVGVARDTGQRQERWEAPKTLAPAQEQRAQDDRTEVAPQVREQPPGPIPHQAAPDPTAPIFAPPGVNGFHGLPSTEQPVVPPPLQHHQQQPPPPGFGYGGPPPTTYPQQGGTFSSGPDIGEPLPTRSARAPRRARLTLRHLDPLSMLKFSLVLAAALFVVWMVAVGVLYGVLSGMGVFDKINSTANEVNGSTGDVVTPSVVFGAAAVVGAINIVLFTAFATIGSFIYNLCADMVGGLEVTLAERD